MKKQLLIGALITSLLLGPLVATASTFNDELAVITTQLKEIASRLESLSLASVATSGNPMLPAVATQTALSHAKGRILVSFRPGLSEEREDKILSEHGGKKSEKLNGINVHIVALPANANEVAIANALMKNPHVEFAEVDMEVAPSYIPNDPSYSQAWQLAKINAPLAWDMTKGGGITIAILDAGVDCTHPDLAANCVAGWNTASNNSNTSAINDHGTKAAGTAAAVGDNAIGLAGVSYSSKIMPIRITNDAGGAITYWSYVANGITWAADRGARIVSNSYVSSDSLTVQSAATYLRNKGGLFVAAAGNGGILLTAANPTMIITTGATDSVDVRASWSSYGPVVDVAAPGVNVYTTVSSAGYGSVSGTSFSTPITAATLGLILSAKPSLTPAQAETILFSTAQDLGSTGWDQYYGWGRVDANNAVLAATSVITPDTSVPTVSISSPTNGQTVSGTITVNASSSDNVGVSKVELFVAGQLHATDTTAPYGFSWDTTTRADGSASLVAKAYDAAGNVGTSATVSVTIANAPADTVAPTVSLTSPVNGQTVSGTISVSANASDNVAVTGVQFKLNGTNLGSEDTSSPYGVSWNTANTQNGTHSLIAVARDLAGNTTTSSEILVTVSNVVVTKFVLGDRVAVTSGKLNIRSTPSLNGTVVGKQSKNAGGTVVSGPVSADGYTWWNINFDTGVDGWAAENYLKKI